MYLQLYYHWIAHNEIIFFAWIGLQDRISVARRKASCENAPVCYLVTNEKGVWLQSLARKHLLVHMSRQTLGIFA